MSKRLTPAAIVLAVLACGAVAPAVLVVGSPAATTAASRTASVTRGVVLSTVSGTGNLAPSRQAELDFPASGELTAVYVKAGEQVVTDQLLARVDDSSAKVDLAKAEADLASAQAAQVAAAATPTPTPTAAPVASRAQQAAATATPSASSSGSNSNANSGSNQSPAEAAAAVDSAELAVTSAEKALTATQLRAPMSGTIAAVNGAVGDTTGPSSSASASSASSSDSSSSTSFITLAKLHRFKVDVSLSESDIGKVKKGQPATVTVNAVSGLELAGHVTNVGVLTSSTASSTTGASTSSAVSYPVTVTLDQGSSAAKAGMSASVEIVTGKATGLTVPTQALSGSTVTVVKSGKRTSTRVDTGLAGDSSTEILSGVKAGDQVAVSSASAAAGANASRTGGGTANQLGGAQRRFGGGGFGGGGFGGGGGAGPVVRGGP